MGKNRHHEVLGKSIHETFANLRRQSSLISWYTGSSWKETALPENLLLSWALTFSAPTFFCPRNLFASNRFGLQTDFSHWVLSVMTYLRLAFQYAHHGNSGQWSCQRPFQWFQVTGFWFVPSRFKTNLILLLQLSLYPQQIINHILPESNMDQVPIFGPLLFPLPRFGLVSIWGYTVWYDIQLGLGSRVLGSRSSDQDERLGGLHGSVHDRHREDPWGRGVHGAELELFFWYFWGWWWCSPHSFFGCRMV